MLSGHARAQMETLDISLPQMVVVFGVVLLPWLLLSLLGLRLGRDIGLSIFRMTLQLGLVGAYLKTLLGTSPFFACVY